MGLDLKDVDLPPSMNVWHALGLSYVLSPGPGSRSNRKSPEPCQSPVPEFPEPWSRILDQASLPCATVWTYWHLPLDLFSDPPTARKRLFQNIRTSLGWPETEVVFWPLSAEVQNRLQPRTDFFRRGLAHIQPRYVLLFGVPALRELFPQKDRSNYGLFIDHQITYIFLPGPEDMLPDQKQAKNYVWTTLKTITL